MPCTLHSTLTPVELLEAITRAQSAFIDSENASSAFRGLLEDLLRLTRSQLGFIGTVRNGENGKAELVMAAFSGMPSPPRQESCPEEPALTFGPQLGSLFTNPTSLLGRTISTRQPVIARRPETDSISAQLPSGHSPVTTFLSLPIMAGGEVIAVAGLANRAEEYTQNDVEALLPLTTVVAQLLVADRLATERRALESRLRAGEAALRSVLDHAPVGIWLLNSDGRLEFVNKVFCDSVGIPEARFTSIPDYAVLYDAETARRCKAADAAALAADGPHRSEERVLFSDGKMHDLETVKVRLLDEQGIPTGKLIGISTDVTARRFAESRLKLLAGIFENAREGITLTDIEGLIVDVNPRFCEITGYTREEVIGQNPRILASGRQDATFYSTMWNKIKSTGHWRGEIWNRRKNGEIYPELLSISLLKGIDSSSDHYLAVFTDISDLKAHQNRLEHLAHFDALTHLPNRVLLAGRMGIAISQARRNARSLAVCYLDLDGFKPINDQHGHQFGDHLLIEVAQRLSLSLRGGDSVARLGGDEFVLLLNDLTSLTECDAVINRLLRTIAQPIVIEGETAQVTASLGVTLFPEDDSDVDTLLRHADQALYIAKEAGRNRYHVFNTSHDQGLRARREGLEQFEVALALHQLRLHYQPKVDMRRGRVVGAEALIRWQHPERGLLAPAQFLSVIENSPADVALGEWVIQEALRQMNSWRGAGIDLAVSVNISAYHLAQENFVSRLKGFLGIYPEMPSHCLEIEILETAALEDISHITTLMAECQALGVGFALDDFGTGYSSLTYLKRLPAATLKIDQSFIRDMLHDSDDLAIVEGIIGLSQAFRRVVIAEGVETIEHGVTLLQMGCDLAQGYGIARPMSAEKFPDWLAQWQPDGAWVLAAGVQCSSVDVGLIMAEQDHRRWLENLKTYLLAEASETKVPPLLEENRCRFMQWYEGAGSQRFSNIASFSSIGLIHEKLHTIGRELVALHEQGNIIEARSRIQELEGIGEEMVAGLHALLIAISME